MQLFGYSTKSRVHEYPSVPMAILPDRQILTTVRPIGLLCRLFGVFPFTFTHQGDNLTLTHRRGPWFLVSLLILLITTAYLLFQLGSFIHCLPLRPVLDLTAQSIWIITALPSWILSIFMLSRGPAVTALFQDWAAIERDLERLFCPIRTKAHVLKFLRIYLGLAIVSVSLVGYHAYQKPRVPVYPFFYLEEYSEVGHLAWVGFQMVIVIWIWAGLTILEGMGCLFATVVGQCMTTLEMGLEFTFHSGEEEQKCVSMPHVKDLLTPSQQTHEQFMKSAVASILRKHGNKGEEEPGDGVGPFKTEPISKEDYILFVVRKLQTVGRLQNKVNNILGPLLLLDVAQLVLLTSLMFFLPLRFSAKLEGFELGVTFLGNGVGVVVRLVVFVVSLGSVYSKGISLNGALASGLISAELGTACQNPVLAHLSVYSSNPITFTAWDFFPITRGTLLAAFSLISTYAIVFLQFNF